MERRLYKLATIASVVTAIAAIALAIASFPLTARWRISSGPPRAWFAESSAGMIHVWFQELSFSPPLPSGYGIDVSMPSSMSLVVQSPILVQPATYPMYHRMDVIKPDHQFAGFGFGEKRLTGGGLFPVGRITYVASAHWMNVQAPWLVIAPLACVPMVWLLTIGRRRVARLNAGKCLHCSYDLRASPQRCPECGKPVNDPDEAAELRTSA
jgi:hypothetical protein